MTIRTSRLAAAAVCLALVLTACSDDDQPQLAAASGSGSTASAESPTSSAAFPVTVAHRYGETTIDKPPTRIVVAGLVEQDVLLALGIVPVATTEWFGEQPGAIFPWATEKLGEADPPAVLSFTDGLQHEGIAAQRPDLILGLYSGMTQEDYDKLSAIAPTVAQPTETDYELDWQKLTRTVGQAVGRADDADALVEDIEDQFAATREEHPEFDGLHAMLATPFEGYGVYGAEDPRSQIMADLGFEFPPTLDEVVGDSFFGNLSRERLDLLDQDVLVWYVETPEQVTDILDDELYASLDVAEQGRDVFLDDGNELYNAFQFSSVLSLPVLIDGLTELLAAAVDGDPATEVDDDREGQTS